MTAIAEHHQSTAFGDEDEPRGRQVPQDIPAEMAVLGGMLLSKDACAGVVELNLQAGDFYRPVHAKIFDTIVHLYAAGVPVDIVTVGTALLEAGDLVRVGGAPYLHTLIDSVPTAANATYYSRSVLDTAVDTVTVAAQLHLSRFVDMAIA